ncbi:MAG: ATP-binding protein [Rhodoferax sp.]
MKPVSKEQKSAVPRLWWVALGLGVALSIVSAAALWHLRRDAFDSQARELDLLSLALTDEIDRGLQGAEEGLQALRGELREGRLAVSGDEATLSLRTHAQLMPLVRTLWLVDRDGRVISASDTTSAPDLASFSPALNRLAEDATAVSRPYMDQSTHESLVALAVRFSEASGTSGAWVLATMPASSLLGAFSAASPATDAHMAVFRSDGVRLAGSIVNTPTLDEAGVAARLARPRSIELRQFRDGTERLVSVRSLPRYGLKVMLTRDLEVVLVGWHEAVRLTVFGLVLVLSIMAVSVFLIQRANQRRARAQHALQAQLSRTSTLESLGTLAGGVSHDFNNVLAAIVGFGEMAQDAAVQGSDQARHLDKVLQAALRGQALVERILAFSRGGARTSIVFELEPVVEEVLSLLAVSLRSGVLVEQELAASAGCLRGDPTQAFKAVMNLCTNAMQAMPGDGMLSVRLVRLQAAEPRVLSHSQLAAGAYLVLSVSDQGIGITPDVMNHLFEPFFTTRGANAGTGLGLAVVHGVVAEFGGAIDVQSTPGQGARFSLYFPECTDPVDASARLLQSDSKGAGQTLLVVDDDPALVALAVEMLTGLGYEPIGYSDPVAALQAVRTDPQRFAAVITDEVMPGLTGTQLIAALSLDAPHVPVLLVSAYGGALLAQRAVSAGVTKVLAKPLQRAELARALADLLHRA